MTLRVTLRYAASADCGEAVNRMNDTRFVHRRWHISRDPKRWSIKQVSKEKRKINQRKNEKEEI